MDAITEIQEEVCAILVHGFVPEFMPHLAFRRDKHYKAAGTKIIKCPYCGDIFTVVEVTAKLELIRYSRKTKIHWHDSMLCRFCHNLVGIIYAST